MMITFGFTVGTGQVISTGQGMLENLRALIAELMNKGIQSLRYKIVEFFGHSCRR
jgi:hypothetical protein